MEIPQSIEELEKHIKDMDKGGVSTSKFLLLYQRHSS